MPYSTPEALKAYRERTKEKKRQWDIESHWRHRETRLAAKAAYRQANLDEIRRKQLEATRADRAKHHDRWLARWAVGNAVRSGKLPKVRDVSCVDCGSQATRYDHYKGYAKERHLDVQPVCHRCDGVRKHKRGEMRHV